MGSYNSLDEILEFAIAREGEAYQLYQHIATEIEDSDIRRLCECFAKEELEHKGKLELEALKKKKGKCQLKLSDYIKDMGKDLLNYAVKKEQHSIDLYTHLAEVVEDGEFRKVLLSLAREETKHKQKFENEYKKLMKEK